MLVDRRKFGTFKEGSSKRMSNEQRKKLQLRQCSEKSLLNHKIFDAFCTQTNGLLNADHFRVNKMGPCSIFNFTGQEVIFGALRIAESQVLVKIMRRKF